MAGIHGAGADLTSDPRRVRVLRTPSVSVAGLWLRLMYLVALGVLAQGLFVSGVAAQEAPRTPPTAAVPDSPGVEVTSSVTVNRDSLMSEIRTYSLMIRGLRDSLSSDGSGVHLSAAQREKLESSIADVSRVIEQISDELSRLEFEIKDNRISLVDESGEGIVINVPEDLDEHVSEGIEALSRIILSELPDSASFDAARKWDWHRLRPEPPAPARRVINGNIVKVWDDASISDKEDVRGNVVVIFGNADIAGRVDGNVVTIFGGMTLSPSSEVTGSAVSIGGQMDQEAGAEVDDVVVLDPLHFDRGQSWSGFLRHDGLSFLVSQGVFLLTVMLALVAVAVTPQQRFTRIIGQLRGGVAPSLGLGVLAALGGHLLVAVLMAILVLTVIGIPLALLVGLMLGVAVVVSVAVCAAAVGERTCSLFGGECHSPVVVALVGMVALHVVSFLGSLLGLVGGVQPLASLLVALGFAIKTLAYLFGLGALVRSRLGTSAPAKV